MTNKEIDKLLDMLDRKSLDQVKKYLLEEKENNEYKKAQAVFEKYITNFDKSLYVTNSGTQLFVGNDNIVFTNGASIYYVNKDVYDTDTNKIKKYISSNSHGKHWKHLIHMIDYWEIEKMENHLISLSKTKTTFDNLGNTFVSPLEILGEDKYIEVSYVDADDIRREVFSDAEFEYSRKLLKEPTYRICKKAPILYGKSDIGKVYILGRKKDNN